MRIRTLLLAVLLLGGCAHDTPAPGAVAPARSTATLIDTYWKLTQLWDEQVASPAGTREVHLILQSQNQRVTGFSGCNRMTGQYAMNGSQIKFDQMAGTLMACVESMDLEKKFLAIFPEVARWEIAAQTLRLLDAQGKTLATFDAVYPK